jgi:hypothetical protein
VSRGVAQSCEFLLACELPFTGLCWGGGSQRDETVLPKKLSRTLDLQPHMRIMAALLTKIVDKVNKTREGLEG